MKRLTPLQAIRKQCLSCMGGSYKFVEECQNQDCSLFPYRLGRIEPGTDRRTLKAIHNYCLDCLGSAKEVKECQGNEPYLDNEPCFLWLFRLGTNPNISKETREKRRAIAQNHKFKPMDKRVFVLECSKMD